MRKWTPEKTDVVRALYQAHSASVIALMINERFGGACTRNSVMGIVYRFGLKKGGMGRLPEINARSAKPRRPAPKRPKVATMKPKPEWKPSLRRRGPLHTRHPVPVPSHRPGSLELPLADRRSARGEFFFCGAVVVPDRQYCPTHLRQAFGKEAA
jgi:hypothetical protein